MNYDIVGKAMIWAGIIFTITLIILGLIFIPMGMEKRKHYGLKRDLEILKKRKKIKYKSELLLLILEKLPQYKRILYSNNFKNILIFIDGTGVKLFQILNKTGNFEGNITDETLTNIDNKFAPQIPNPIINLKENKTKIQKILNNEEIEMIVITDNKSSINYNDTRVRTMKIVQVNGWLNVHGDKYTNDQIEKIYEKISKEA